MGRRKKDANISYAEIVSAAYLKKADYEKAQVMFAGAVDSKPKTSNTVNNNQMMEFDWETEGEEDIFD